jgi:O-antigen/teichoic acid export membrane protein
MFTTIILSGFKIAIAPTVSYLYHNGDYVEIKTLAKSVTRLALYLSAPILIFVFVNANVLITSLFGFAYQTGTVPLLILTLGQFFYVAFGITDQLFLMTGKQKEWAGISALIFVLTIIFDAILIPRANLIGASIVSSTMMFLLGSAATIRLKHHLKFWLFDNHHAKIIAAALITTLITNLVAIALPFGLITNLIMTIVIICTLFVMLLVLSGLEASDKTLIHRIMSKAKAPHK